MEFLALMTQGLYAHPGATLNQMSVKEAVKLIGKGELLIYDLGYFDTNSMIDLSEREAYNDSDNGFPVRFHSEVCMDHKKT